MFKCVGIIKILLSLMILCFLVVGCEKLPATSTTKSSLTETASTYPADISGHVTIPEYLHIRNMSDRSAVADQVFWVVDISIKNISYERSVTSDYENWYITVGDEIYLLEGGLTQLLHLRDKTTIDNMDITLGHTGQTTICFSVPDTLNVSDARLCYRGQEPFSYGKLTGGDVVAVYDWDLKKAVPEEAKPTKVIVVGNWKFQINSLNWDGSTININLTITNLGTRRTFGYFEEPNYGDELAVIDSTDKLIKAWSPEPKSKEELLKEVFSGYPYEKEYYPNESWTGNLTFVMSPYSGKTSLYYGQYYWTKEYNLFDLGAPQ
jgi:hypothetical protein